MIIFQNILEENKKFEAYIDICPLKILGGSDAAISDIPYQVRLIKLLSVYLEEPIHF